MSENKPFFIAKEKGDLIIIQMGGDLIASTLPQSREMVDELIEKHEIKKRTHLKILVDYEQVTDVDSATIANILDRINEHKKNYHTIAFVNVSEEFKSIIEIHKLEDEIRIFDSREEAIEALMKRSQ